MGKKLRKYLVQKLDDIQRLSSKKVPTEDVSESEYESASVGESPPPPVTPQVDLEPSVAEPEDVPQECEYVVDVPQESEYVVDVPQESEYVVDVAQDPEDVLDVLQDAEDVVVVEPPQEPEDALANILEAFEKVRQSLQGIEEDAFPFERFSDATPGFDLEAVQSQLPATVEDLENFNRFFGNLESPIGDDVLATELQKRQVMYQATKCTLESIAEVHPSLLHLMSLLSPKSYIVAYYAIVQGVEYPDLHRCTIFDSSPSLGTDASDIFATYLHEIYLEGCKMLGLDPLQFSDDVSISELRFIVNTKGHFLS